MMTSRQVAQQLNISIRTVNAWRESGLLQGERFGHVYGYSEKSVESAIAKAGKRGWRAGNSRIRKTRGPSRERILKLMDGRKARFIQSFDSRGKPNPERSWEALKLWASGEGFSVIAEILGVSRQWAEKMVSGGIERLEKVAKRRK